MQSLEFRIDCDTSRTMKKDIPAPILLPRRRIQIPFPSYRYVPGRHPHPIKDPRGHMMDREPSFSISSSWKEDTQFLYAADLFDARFYWEAHENWEQCWHRSNGVHRSCLQGLIQLSAAILKHHMGSERARDRLFRSAQEKLGDAPRIGCSFKGVLQQTKAFFEGGEWPILGEDFPRLME